MRKVWLIVLISGLLGACSSNKKTDENKDIMNLYVGTYTQKLGHVDGNAKGILKCSFDQESGKLSKPNLVTETENPSFITPHPNGKFVFAVNEKGGEREHDMGTVVAFSTNENGNLEKINEAPSGGKYPCHISVSDDGNYLFTANYGGGLAMHIIHENGRLGKSYWSVKHKGNGPNARQESSHIHMAQAMDSLVWVNDLGTDLVTVYSIDKVANALKKKQQITLAPGTGPRHLCATKNKELVFVVGELNSTVSVLRGNATQGWQLIKSFSTLKSGATDGACGDIHLGTNERYLYVSNRGVHNSISIFEIDKKNASLALLQEIPVEGKTPRNFVISPNGKYMLVANQDSRNIVVYKVNSETGLLSKHKSVKVDTPVCLKFAPAF